MNKPTVSVFDDTTISVLDDTSISTFDGTVLPTVPVVANCDQSTK